MSNEQKTVWNSGNFDELEFMVHTVEKDTVKPKFIDNEPQVNTNKFKSVSYDFQVIDTENNDTVKTYSATSKRLMKGLEEHNPLSGKILSIKRIGSGMDTDYVIKLVK